MSVLAQRLTYMRCTCPMILRLYYQRNNPCVDLFSKYKLSTLTWSRVHHLAYTWINSHRSRGFAILATDYQQMTDDEAKNSSVDSPEKIRENEYARRLFVNSIHYKETIMQPYMIYTHITNKEALEILEQDCNFITQKQILSIVKKLSYNMFYSKESIEPLKYKNIFDVLHLHYQQLSNDDLMVIIRHLVPFKNHLMACKFYQTFCNNLDKECIQRFPHLSISETMLLCDMMYLIHPGKSQYIWYSIRRLGNKPQKLSPHQLVQVLFFLNVCRKPPINMYELEYCLEQCMDDLSINELGVAALGFFKTGTPIRSSEFLHRLMKKSIAEMDTVHSVSIGALLKQMRYYNISVSSTYHLCEQKSMLL